MLKKIGEYYRYFYTIYQGFPKLDKHGIGKRIIDESLELYIIIFKASKLNHQDYKKKKLLIQAQETLDLIRFLIRNCHELSIINQKRYLILTGQLLEIGKMLGGLIKSLTTKQDRT